MDNEFLLMDRIQKIKQVIEQYGEENFYLSFSGGKDSTVLHYLLDMAIPGNSIPRVYANTGIEYNLIRKFVEDLADVDERIEIIKPTVPIKPMLEKEGYPFKSKEHSLYVDQYQRHGLESKTVQRYLHPTEDRKGRGCIKKLEYQFTPQCKLRISSKCCDKLKKEPLNEYKRRSGRIYAILGVMPTEGGQRNNANCLAFKNGKLKAFQPLAAVTKEWEEWFIDRFNIQICDIYKEPYNFDRTGCKGCPYAMGKHLRHELDVLEKYFPAERKQCEIIWKPVYDEYRRLGYRLKAIEENHQYTIGEFMKEE